MFTNVNNMGMNMNMGNNMMNMNPNNNFNNMNINDMNMTNSFGNINNNNMIMNNMNMNNNNPPLNIIKNYSSNYESSYDNSVFQGLSSLDCISNWINELNNSSGLMQNNQAIVTKDFYILFSNLFCGNQVDSTNLISTLENQVRAIYNKNMKKDEYHALYYILELLHSENNCPINPNFDINSYNNQKSIENMKNENFMFNSFSNFYQQTTNSLISQYFYNIEKYYTSCFNCGKIFYYDHKVIITFELDKYQLLRNQLNPNRMGSNINLDECFSFYQNEKDCQCPICQGPMAKEKTELLSPAKVLILRFKRSSHNFSCDVDFNYEFNINNVINSNNSSMNSNYMLKSIISINQTMNGFKYFSDVLINGNWYRYIDNNDCAMNININNNELKMFEPQVLIYELKESNDNMNPFASSMNQNNNNMKMQMSGLQNNFMNNFPQNPFPNAMNMGINNNNNNFAGQNNFNPNQMNNNNNNNNQNSLYLTLEFFIVPENWDGNEENSIKIVPQVTFEDTIEKAINNFFIKLVKPKEAIKRFEFNNNNIDPSSKATLRDFGLKDKSKILAIKADNFDTLVINSDNNSNNNNNNNNNSNNNNSNNNNINVNNNNNNINNNSNINNNMNDNNLNNNNMNDNNMNNNNMNNNNMNNNNMNNNNMNNNNMNNNNMNNNNMNDNNLNNNNMNNNNMNDNNLNNNNLNNNNMNNNNLNNINMNGINNEGYAIENDNEDDEDILS